MKLEGHTHQMLEALSSAQARQLLNYLLSLASDGVPERAIIRALKRRYIKIHPDKHPGEQYALATEVFNRFSIVVKKADLKG